MKYSAAKLSFVLAAVSIGLAGCGNIQIPSSAPPRDINTPPQTRSQQSAPVRSSPVQAAPSGTVTRAELVSANDNPASFVGASAVVVGPGDTVYELSRRHRVPVPAIIRANDLEPPYLLRVGQRIELPRGRQHRVVTGDTLYSIAQTYDAVLYELARLNDVDAPYTIKLGEILVIPESDGAAAKVAPKATPGVTAEASPPPPQPEPRQMERAPQTPQSQGRVAVTPPVKPPAPVPPPASRTGKGFQWPVQGPLMSNFGTKDGGLRNDGINIIAPEGTAVVAAENGVVAYAGNEIRGFGNLLLIKHADGYVTAYAHNHTLLVERGQRVRRGQKISTVGATGSVSRPQLHFEIRKGRRPQDPQKYLQKT